MSDTDMTPSDDMNSDSPDPPEESSSGNESPDSGSAPYATGAGGSDSGASGANQEEEITLDPKEVGGKALRRGVRLPWPPPGLEWMQGKLWRVITLAWIGAVVMVLPLLYSLGIEPDFWSLGPLESNWEVGLAVAGLGAAILLYAFFLLFSLSRFGGKAADQGYGFLTIAEVATDMSRDTGFLLMGKRHFQRFTPGHRAALARRRMWGALLLLVGAAWLATGFSLSVLLASRGVVSPRETVLLTLGPSLIFAAVGGLFYLIPATTIRLARRWWIAEEGGEGRQRREVNAWVDELNEAPEEHFVMGGGAPAEGGRFRNGAFLVALVSILVFVPTLTIAFSAAVGPILAEIALPQFLSVQEMAGAAQALDRYRLPTTSDRTATTVGRALHSLEFVGAPMGAEDPHELPPARPYTEPWFPTDFYPDAFSEGVGLEVVLQIETGFAPEEVAAIRQAARHPAQSEFDILATADRIDMVATRWVTPFADSINVLTLPWPRFEALRTAALARVSLGVTQQLAGRPAMAEETMREVISTGFLLIEHGPTLIDNLIGVVIANIGGDALEGLYQVQGRTGDLETLRWSREAAEDAARAARTGIPEDDIHTTLRGIPDIVTNEDALRGLRWEYFATFNLLSPCINLHKMVFGPEDTYEEWLDETRETLVRVPGEAPLFDLAKADVYSGEPASGFVPALLRFTLGNQTRPGTCLNLISSAEGMGVLQ